MNRKIRYPSVGRRDLAVRCQAALR